MSHAFRLYLYFIYSIMKKLQALCRKGQCYAMSSTYTDKFGKFASH